MTDLHKICPNSGEKCDCPKGVCNAAVEKLVKGLAASPQGDYWNGVDETPVNKIITEPKLYHEQFHEHDARQFAVYQQAAEQLCEDEGCPHFGIPHVCLDEQSRIDRQEAGSLKYALCAQVLMLSSGKFALFGAYSMDEGIPLLIIDTWENLEPHVRAYRKTAEDGYALEKQNEEQRRGLGAEKAAANYDELFGEEG